MSRSISNVINSALTMHRETSSGSIIPIVVLDDDEINVTTTTSIHHTQHSPSQALQNNNTGTVILTVVIDSDSENTDVTQTSKTTVNIQTEKRLNEDYRECRMKPGASEINVTRYFCFEETTDIKVPCIKNLGQSSSTSSGGTTLPEIVSMKTAAKGVYENCNIGSKKEVNTDEPTKRECKVLGMQSDEPDSTSDKNQNARGTAQKRCRLNSEQCVQSNKKLRSETNAASAITFVVNETTPNLGSNLLKASIIAPMKKKKHKAKRKKGKKKVKTNQNNDCIGTLQNIGNIMVNVTSDHKARPSIEILDEIPKKGYKQNEVGSINPNSTFVVKTFSVPEESNTAAQQNEFIGDDEVSRVVVQCHSLSLESMTRSLRNHETSLAKNNTTVSDSNQNNRTLLSTQNAPLGSATNPIIISDKDVTNAISHTSRSAETVSCAPSLTSDLLQRIRPSLPSLVQPAHSLASSTIMRQVAQNPFAACSNHTAGLLLTAQPLVMFPPSACVPLATTTFLANPSLPSLLPSVCLSRTIENVLQPLQMKKKLRPIAIDGSNVAFSHGKNSIYSCKGIQLCVDYFAKRGHMTIKAFVPQFRRRHSTQVTHQHILEELGKKQIVVFTPSREIYGNTIASYDDRFIIEYASKTGAVIVSNDNFRDLMNENPVWKEVIISRLLMYTFADDVFMVPKDPFGQRGPTLDQFLCF